MFDSLSEALGNVFRKLSGRGRLSESNIEEGLQEVRRALLSADANFKIVKTLGQQNAIPVYFEPSGRPVKICERGIAKAQEQGQDVVILDTQGRLHIDREMMDELKEIKDKIKPNQTYLVVDAMTGQDAVK